MQRTCQHIKTSGARCRAVALTAQMFCFWHARIHRQHREANRTFPANYCAANSVENRTRNAEDDDIFTCIRPNYPMSNEIPPLEDPESIQITLSIILQALADSRIHFKQAALMLYTLQIAAQNVRSIRPAIEDSVEHITTTDLGIEIAVDPEGTQLLGTPEPVAHSEPAILVPAQAKTGSPTQPLAEAA
jgi:hypothetical protein